MVRRAKPPKKKKKTAPAATPNPNDIPQEEEGEKGPSSFAGAFSMLSIHPFELGSTSTSCSSEVGFDSNSNGDYPSTSSNGDDQLFWESDLVQMPRRGGKGFGGGGGGNKQKRTVACAGTVANFIGKGYVRDSPSGGKRQGSLKMKGLYNNKAANNAEAEQFLYAMLGDDCELSMTVVGDVLCQCGYDVEKALDVLLDLSAPSSHNDSHTGDDSRDQYSRSSVECDGSGDYEIAQGQMSTRTSESTFDLSEKEVQQIFWASGHDYRKYSEVLGGTKKQTSPVAAKLSLPQTLLESLFSIPRSSEREPDSMNWKNVVKKMDLLGQGSDFCTDRVNELRQDMEYAKGEDYMLFRKSATQHYDAMKSCYQKAATAYSNGQRSYAAILSDQGKVHNKMAREADEKASQEIFQARNMRIQNTVTIDLHGQHVNQAIRLLKVHLLLFTTYVHSVQVLRVITGCGTHGLGKSKLKQSVISLVEKEGINWSEENQGTLLIKLDGQKNFNFVESEDESELVEDCCPWNS